MTVQNKCQVKIHSDDSKNEIRSAGLKFAAYATVKPKSKLFFIVFPVKTQPKGKLSNKIKPQSHEKSRIPE